MWIMSLVAIVSTTDPTYTNIRNYVFLGLGGLLPAFMAQSYWSSLQAGIEQSKRANAPTKTETEDE
jgi:hypothetical protein